MRYPALLILLLFTWTQLRGQSAASSPVSELLKIEQHLIPTDRKWRLPQRKLIPEFITIHSTDNESSGANALAHARLLASAGGLKSNNPLSRTGYKCWHFTVDDTRIVQHLPTNEQGDHADFTGKGNQISVGIEICVNKDGDQQKAILRAAALTAHLMKNLNLDIEHVVPHHYWPQPPHGYQKLCPSILLDDGKFGKRWNSFKEQVKTFRSQLN